MRRPNNHEWERTTWILENASLTATTERQLFLVPTGRTWKLDRATYINPTGLAVDATNFFTLQVLNDATVMADWSTETTVGEGAIPADAHATLVNSSTAADLVAAAADVISVNYAEDGTATLPAGMIIIEGHYTK